MNSSNVITDVVPATTSPTLKLEWDMYIKRKRTGFYQCIFLVPFVEGAKVLYKLLWLLAVVGSQCHKSNALA